MKKQIKKPETNYGYFLLATGILLFVALLVQVASKTPAWLAWIDGFVVALPLTLGIQSLREA